MTERSVTATERAAPIARRPGKGRLFRKYAFLFAVAVAAALLTSGLVQIWFAYQEQTAFLIRLQHEQATAAAGKIGQFIGEIEDQIGWTTQLPWNAGTLEQRRFDAQRLLRQVPAITELALLDGAGHEQLKISRVAVDVVGSDQDYSSDPRFAEAVAQKVWFGPIYFRGQSEPYMAIAVGGNRREAGVSVAEVNLKFIWDVVSRIRVGRSGTAYVVDGKGRLIAHPDIALVLRNTDLSSLAQVRAASQTDAAGDSDPQPVKTARDLQGHTVLAAFAPIPPLDWHMFVELPVNEAYEPIYAAVQRSAALLVAGLVLAVIAGLLLARRMVVPIRTLQQGAQRIGDGDLNQRISITTGDELEDLANQFNQMGERLQQLYGNLERVSQLKRYFSPQLAEMIVSSGNTILGESHRREITVVFCDLRNFTAFSSSSAPEVVMQVLAAYYKCLGAELRRSEATIGMFAGDGLMAFFNDPLPCPDHQARGLSTAVAMQKEVGKLVEEWHQQGIELGFGVGIASGYATLGHIGTEDQFHYTAIGPVVNLASRLCDDAESGEILMDAAVQAATSEIAKTRKLEDRRLKGFPRPVAVFCLLAAE
jgi:adenylate cyclase